MRAFKVKDRPAESLEDRVRRALATGQYADAVRFALDIPDHPDLLFDAVMARVKFWRQSGQTNFACDLIRKVLPRLSSNPAWVQALATELAACGGAAEALALTGNAGSMKTVAVDSAVERGASARDKLPDELKAGFDATLQAFAAFRAGNDDEARAQLQQIGLGSPFLDWKLALRGLMAWHASDDAKALENWRRLDMQRPPAKLIAPLRAFVDVEYLRQQAPEQQHRLRRQADRLRGVPEVAELRTLQREITKADPQAVIRRAAVVLAAIKNTAPAGVPKLVEALAATVCTRGCAAHVDLIVSRFPPLAQDPTFAQMRGLVLESAGQFLDARKHWLEYEKALINRPEIFGEHTQRARAIVWHHVGDLARLHMKSLPPQAPPPRLDPSIKQCLNRALELAPDLHLALAAAVDDAAGNYPATVAAAEQLLAVYPHDEWALRQLVEASFDAQQDIDHLQYVQQLHDLHPLDLELRLQLAYALRLAAREYALQKDWAAARTHAEAAYKLEPKESVMLLVALDWRAGQDETAEVRLAGCTQLMCDAARAVRALAETSKLGIMKKFKPRFAPMIDQALRDSLTPQHLLEMADIFGAMENERLTYVGAKTHAGKFAKKLVAAARTQINLPAQAWEEWCQTTLDALWYDATIAAATAARRWFPSDPRFAYFSAIAKLERGRMSDEYSAENDLRRAQLLLGSLPPEDRPSWLAEALDEAFEDFCIEAVDNPFANFSRIFENMFNGRRR